MDRSDMLSAVYRDWLAETFVPWKGRSRAQCHDLLQALDEVEFVWDPTDPLGQNRAFDGLRLRHDFFLEYGDMYDVDWNLMPCSWLEMLISLAIRVEEEYIGDPANLNPGNFFYEMLSNAGFVEGSNVKNKKNITSDLDILQFLPVSGLGDVAHENYIWGLTMAYLTENYYS